MLVVIVICILYYDYSLCIYVLGCCEENDAKFINVDNLNENEVEYDEGDSDDSVSDDDDDDDIEVYKLGDEKKELEQVLEIPVSNL